GALAKALSSRRPPLRGGGGWSSGERCRLLHFAPPKNLDWSTFIFAFVAIRSRSRNDKHLVPATIVLSQHLNEGLVRKPHLEDVGNLGARGLRLDVQAEHLGDYMAYPVRRLRTGAIVAHSDHIFDAIKIGRAYAVERRGHLPLGCYTHPVFRVFRG